MIKTLSMCIHILNKTYPNSLVPDCFFSLKINVSVAHLQLTGTLWCAMSRHMYVPSTMQKKKLFRLKIIQNKEKIKVFVINRET